MGTISSKKTEQKAITKINELIDTIEFADGNLQKNDKSISWDGTIDFYSGNIDKKDNYQFSIDVQVKGRTTNNKKLQEKSYFDLSISDLRNFLKKDGTLLLMCLFKRETEEYKIYYCSLLPYEINKNLKSVDNNSVDKIRVKMKEVKDFNHLENICRNFQLDKEMQKKMSSNMFEQENLIMEKGKTAKFSIWDKDIKNFKPQDLVGMSKYIYEVDEREYPIGVSFGMIYTIIEDLNAAISDKDKTIVYKDIKLETKVGGQKILFGKAFSFDLIKHTFNITIRGTFLERLNQLRFIEKAFVNKCFLINNNSFIFDPSEDSILVFKEMLLKYEKLNCILLKHNINKDLNFDEWKDKDFEKLNIWLSAIEDKVLLKLKSDISLIGSISIGDLRLSILASKGKDNKFSVESLWNDIDYKKYFFMYKNGEDEIKTRNLYLVLNYEAYLADDVNFIEMMEVFNNYSLSDDEYGLLNSQVLEILKAFDINKNVELLFYAKFLINILLEKNLESYEIYYINYCQILKREQKLTETEINELINIKQKTSNKEIQLCCNLLIDSKIEAHVLIKQLDPQTLETFKKYPISIYL